MKSPDNKKLWVRGEDTAAVVYEIGLYVMDGFGSSQIARKLTERRILTPPPYYASRGRKASTTKQGLPYAWDASTVADCGSVMYQCRATNFRREQEYYLCAGYRKSRDFCGQTYSIRTDIPELTPCILHEFVEKIIVHAASDPKGKNRMQEIDIYYKGIGSLEMSKVTASMEK